MAGRDYDRYEGREPSRARLFEDLEGADSERAPRSGDRSGYSSARRPYPEREPFSDRAPRREEEQYYDLNSPAGGNVTITSPKSYSDVQDMIEKLRRGESIIVNLEGLESESAQRILDFLSGASYALGGSMKRVKEMHSTFLVTPHGTGITDTNDDRYLR